ncbi:MAG: molybdopterin-dependent oxidoreductase, partial [Nitrospinae bacterium]|nr:molybdopterin-dependent oxidoreductase [Nitrospinota bacterium]
MSLSEVAKAAPGIAGYIMGQGETQAPAFCPIYTAQIAEVAVNPDSGEVKVLRLVCSQDVGFAMNPTSVVGQMEGGRTASRRGRQYLWRNFP